MADTEVWAEILKLQLNGVMKHIAWFEKFSKAGIHGYAAMHKCHADEEFDKYLHVLDDYITLYNIIPAMGSVVAPEVIDATGTKEEIMIAGMDAYDTWETDTRASLLKLQSELEEGKDYVDELLCDVKKELHCIHLMENDLLDGKYEELDEWLTKKMGDC